MLNSLLINKSRMLSQKDNDISSTDKIIQLTHKIRDKQTAGIIKKIEKEISEAKK